MSEATRFDRGGVPITAVDISAYVVPTDAPESDGTLEWDRTTLVVAEVTAGGVQGLGYTYADRATAVLIRESLTAGLLGQDAFAVPALHERMVERVRNLGRPGVASMAISACDVALWDLKALLLGVPILTLLGGARASVPVYGSGGFTSYTLERLQSQLAGWSQEGLNFVKMKVGRDPSADPARVRAARVAIGSEAQLFVDANGAYSRKQALAMMGGGQRGNGKDEPAVVARPR